MQLTNILTINGTIRLITGLHIGAGKDSIEIGGLDLPIMKNPRTKAPYIPGSSLKGKMRSMLEITQKVPEGPKPRINENGNPCDCGKCLVCDMFGKHSHTEKGDVSSLPTRLIVRDCTLTKEFQNKFEDGNLPLEIKYENIINRVTGKADHPRPVERVPAGVEFTFEIGVKVYDSDEEKNFLELIKTGLKLLELDAIGGHSSRGSGQIKFENLTCSNGSEIDITTVKF